MNYRRAYVPGGTDFFTVVTHERHPVFANADMVQRLTAGCRRVHENRPFETAALVVLPDHLHTIWTLPAGDDDFSTRWRLVKHYVQRGQAEPIWQARFWEHLIRDETDFERHFDYVHANPVKHGLVTRPVDWPYSTFARYVAKQLYRADWCDMVDGLELE